jgi:hypothetical protein
MDNPLDNEASKQSLWNIVTIQLDTLDYSGKVLLAIKKAVLTCDTEVVKQIAKKALEFSTVCMGTFHDELPKTVDEAYDVLFKIRQELLPVAIELDKELSKHDLVISDVMGLTYSKMLETVLNSI